MRGTKTAGVGLAMLLAGCGGSGGGSTTAATPATTPTTLAAVADEGRGRFTLAGAGYDNAAREFTNAAGNLVFCRRESAGSATLWVRLATGRAANGDQTPHVDIDLCNFAGTSTYSVLHDTDGPRTCANGPTAGVWWHDGAREFATTPQAGPCTIAVTRGTNTIDATFECQGLRARDGSGATLDLRNGSFHCSF